MKLIKKIFVSMFLGSMCAITTLEANRFNPDYAPQLYTFQGQFGFHTPFKDLYYKINTIADFDLEPNKLIRLQPLIGDTRWQSVRIENGTKLILSPEINTRGYSDNAKKQIVDVNPYVVIERENDFISIYLYSQGYGNKLVFNVIAFEQFMRNTWWYNQVSKNSSSSWDIGFEFYTAEVDFESKSSPSFLMAQGINMFDIELQWKNYTFSSAQWLYTLIDRNNKTDPKKWDSNLLFKNNIIYKKSLSDSDATHVEKILTDAGFKIN